MERRLHKAFVNLDDLAWAEFRALCVGKRRTVQDELARLVENEIRKARRDTAASVRKKDKAAKMIRAAIKDTKDGTEAA